MITVEKRPMRDAVGCPQEPTVLKGIRNDPSVFESSLFLPFWDQVSDRPGGDRRQECTSGCCTDAMSGGDISVAPVLSLQKQPPQAGHLPGTMHTQPSPFPKAEGPFTSQ